MNTDSSLIAEMRDKAYRDAYVGSQIRMTLPLQVRELRKRREWTQPQLAEYAGMAQPRISELEKPGERRLTIETLLRLASAFDVALQVRFVAFGELIDWSEGLDIDNFAVQPFETEVAEAKRNAILSVPRKPSAGVHPGVWQLIQGGCEQPRAANMLHNLDVPISRNQIDGGHLEGIGDLAGASAGICGRI
jgi:transcriptional regulator with XRE-family HTH domain